MNNNRLCKNIINKNTRIQHVSTNLDDKFDNSTFRPPYFVGDNLTFTYICRRYEYPR